MSVFFFFTFVDGQAQFTHYYTNTYITLKMMIVLSSLLLRNCHNWKFYYASKKLQWCRAIMEQDFLREIEFDLKNNFFLCRICGVYKIV